jgi:hypothetical protein
MAFIGRHQLKALAMMVEKESGEIRHPEFPSVWSDQTKNANEPRYVIEKDLTYIMSIEASTDVEGFTTW